MGRRRQILSLVAFLACLLAAYALRVNDFRWSHLAAYTRTEPGLRYNLVPILCFHNVDGVGPYSVSQERFRHYLSEIREAGIEVIPLRELYEAARDNRLLEKPSLVITIDDDYKNIVRVAAPILREFRYPATFFFYTADIMADPRWGTSWEDLRRLYAEGFDVQNHSYTHTVFHVRLPGESRAEYATRLHREIYTSREILVKNVPGIDPYAFAYPMGYFSDHLRAQLEEAGYELLLTTDSRPVDLTTSFTGTFDRYTIQKRFVDNPEAMFRRQLQYALRPYQPEARDVAAD